MDDRTWHSGPRWRVRRLLAVLSTATLTIGGTPLVATTSAAAAATTVYLVTKDSPHGSEPRQRAFARCHLGDVLVSGGALVDAGFGSGSNVKLTGIQPVVSRSAWVDDGVWTVAEASSSGYDEPWHVTAYAICARPGGVVRDVEVVTGSTEPSRARFQHTAARCPSDKRALGSGAAVRAAPDGDVGDGNGQLGLQLSRTSGPMDISRAAAAATTATPAPWRLVSYAICARPIEGAAVHGTLARFGTYDRCPEDTHILSVGGGGPLSYAGQAFLRFIGPTEDFEWFGVRVNDEPAPPWTSEVAVGAVCAPL